MISRCLVVIVGLFLKVYPLIKARAWVNCVSVIHLISRVRTWLNLAKLELILTSTDLNR